MRIVENIAAGDNVLATRVEKSRIYRNEIAGKVTATWQNACTIETFLEGEIQEWRLYFSDWTINKN